jgi:hypothetical protein
LHSRQIILCVAGIPEFVAESLPLGVHLADLLLKLFSQSTGIDPHPLLNSLFLFGDFNQPLVEILDQ